jgi:hypothetical protein
MGHSLIGLPDNGIFTGWGCQPHAQPPAWRTRPRYLLPSQTDRVTHLTPWYWVPILVAFYGTHELRWDYSYPPVTTWMSQNPALPTAPFGRRIFKRGRWRNTLTKVHLKGSGCAGINWLELAQHRIRYKDLLNKVMQFLVP